MSAPQRKRVGAQCDNGGHRHWGSPLQGKGFPDLGMSNAYWLKIAFEGNWATKGKLAKIAR